MTTVIVGCKLPNGLVIDIPGLKTPITLKGANDSEVIGGHGLTEVPEEVWGAWTKLYADFVPLKRGLVFAQKSERAAATEAKERKGNKTGLEGLDATKPGRGLQAENYEGKKA